MPTKGAIIEEARRRAFFAGSEGYNMPRYNTLTASTTVKWFYVGKKWYNRTIREAIRESNDT